MSLQQAITLGVLVEHETDKGTELRTADGEFRVWHDPAPCRPCSWRWARVTPKEGKKSHGGSGTLKGCLWQTVYAG